MKLIRSHRCAALGLAACLAAVADAATVGRVQGPALIGRPLDVNVPLLLEGAGDAVPACVDSEVYYGDLRVAPNSVSTELQSDPRGASVRVHAMPAVDEPVITVYLHLGCGSRFTRRIVLLSEPDPAAETSRPLPASAGTLPARSQPLQAAINAAPLNLSRSRMPSVRLPDQEASAGAMPAPARRKVAATRAASTVPKPRPPAAAQAPAAARPASAPRQVATSAGRDQLKLDAPVGVADPAPSNEETLRQAARLQAIERDLGDMRQFLKRNDAAMLQLQSQLARAEADRYSNPLVYALVALLALMAGFTAFFWRRATMARDAMAADWWRDPAAGQEPPPRRAAPEPPARAVAPTRPEPVRDVHEAGEKPRSRLVSSAPDPLQPVWHEPVQPPTMHAPLHPLQVSARTDGEFQPSQTSTRALKAEELHDVQQEADFFSSLGEYDRAIDVLRSHIQANPETSAVAWLDLMEIYHRLGRRDDFEWVRREFQRRFNANVPEFDIYSLENAGIEAYDHAMQRIVALWPARRVLDVIEESIFRGPGKDGAQAFSLQAYRELLLLHHIGQQVLTESGLQSGFHEDPGAMLGGDPDFGAEDFSHTSIHPLSTGLPGGDESGRASEPLELDLNLDDDDAGARGGLLDFDLPDVDPASIGTAPPLRH